MTYNYEIDLYTKRKLKEEAETYIDYAIDELNKEYGKFKISIDKKKILEDYFINLQLFVSHLKNENISELQKASCLMNAINKNNKRIIVTGLENRKKLSDIICNNIFDDVSFKDSISLKSKLSTIAGIKMSKTLDFEILKKRFPNDLESLYIFNTKQASSLHLFLMFNVVSDCIALKMNDATKDTCMTYEEFLKVYENLNTYLEWDNYLDVKDNGYSKVNRKKA